jgi:hypothetical protein
MRWTTAPGSRRYPLTHPHGRGWVRSHRGRVVQRNGYTSIMGGAPYDGDNQQIIWTNQAKDVGPFSLAWEPELLLPRSLQWQVENVLSRPDGIFIEVADSTAVTPVRREYQFHAD